MRRKLITISIVLLELCSCISSKTIMDYNNAKWSYNDENINFYFVMGQKVEGLLNYDNKEYSICLSIARDKKRIFFYNNDLVLEYHLSKESLLFVGDSTIENDICYIKIVEDNVFNGSITEMQLTYSSLD